MRLTRRDQNKKAPYCACLSETVELRALKIGDQAADLPRGEGFGEARHDIGINELSQRGRRLEKWVGRQLDPHRGQGSVAWANEGVRRL